MLFEIILPMVALLMGVEVLICWRNAARFARMAPTLGAGIGLVLAWRAQLGALPLLSLGLLAAAGAAHLTDLRRRW